MPSTSPYAHPKSSWIRLAALNIPVIQAAQAMKCSKKTAFERLEEAHSILDSPHQLDAVAVIQASGAVRQEVSRRAWPDVLLGYKHAI